MLCLLLFSLLFCGLSSAVNLRPIIGILSEPPYDGPGQKPTKSMFSSAYAKWLSQAGARVAPMRFDLPTAQLQTLFKSVNGLFYTGGMNSLLDNTTYFQTASMLFEWAKKANDAGDYFPIWGTCQGFQLMSVLAAKDQSVLLHDEYDSWNLSLPINLLPAANDSRLFSALPPSVVKTLSTTNATQNLHHNGVLPETFEKNANLKSMFKLLSVNVDLRGKPFGSTMEGVKYPFYATQWHPERNQFDWGEQEDLDKGEDAIVAMQEIANFFVSETRMNTHKFASAQEEKLALIYNYVPTFTGDQGTYPDEETYFFPLISSK